MRSSHRMWLFLLALATLVAARPAPAATAFSGVDALQSTVMQKGQSSFSGMAVRTRLTSARLVPGFDFLPSIEYWRSKTTVSAFGIETSRRS